jgi:hypothetical protein
MGMDVYGNNPTSETGDYFRLNVWWWHPLANYCCEVAPEITAPCTHWHSNDGDGLDAERAGALAEALQREISAGRTAAYEKIYTSKQEMAPNEPCDICDGTGTRKPVPERELPEGDEVFVMFCGPEPEIGAGDPNNGGIKCNGCDGTGTVRPWATNYPFSVEKVEKFVAFLRECGGFCIW